MKAYPSTLLLLVSLLAMFGVELALGAIGSDTQLLALGAIPDAGTIGSEYWRLLTYAWLHAGSMHLVTNAALLFWAGRIVERRLGSLPLLGLYLGGAVVGGMLILLRASMDPKPGVSLGASGAVSSLLTCALVLVYRPSAARFGQALWVRVTLWVILVCGISISFLPGVSLVGHVGGLALGALFGCFVPIRKVELTSTVDLAPEGAE